MGEHHLLLGVERNDGYSIMKYCPFCGERNHPSHRGNFFTVPTEEEKAFVWNELEGVKAADELFAKLG